MTVVLQVMPVARKLWQPRSSETVSQAEHVLNASGVVGVAARADMAKRLLHLQGQPVDAFPHVRPDTQYVQP
jgi:hypothetical protein